MNIVRVADKYGVIHNYNPQYIKDVQEIESNAGDEWCLNIILAGEGERINSILFKTKSDMEELRDKIVKCIESI